MSNLLLNHFSRQFICQINRCLPKRRINLDANTNVTKDVILFKYENPSFYRYLNIFAICQFGFWSYLSHFAFTSLRDAPAPKTDVEVSWWRKINLGENKYRNTLTVVSFLVGMLRLTV